MQAWQPGLFQNKYNKYRAMMQIMALFVTRRNKACFVLAAQPLQIAA